MSSKNGQESYPVYLDAYDSYIYSNLKGIITKEFHIKYQEIEPVVEECVDKAKQILGANLSTGLEEVLHNIRIPFELLKLSKEHVYLVLSQKKKFDKIKSEIRDYGCVLLGGAGLSYGSYAPLSKDLGPIMDFCKIKDFSELKRDQVKLNCFKDKFVNVCANKSPSKSHKIVANNFDQHIKDVILLNWDNLLERALTARSVHYTKINKEGQKPALKNLWKMHGDVDFLTEDNVPGLGGWVFPGDGGFVFESLKNYYEMPAKENDIFVVLIVGYSLEDQLINKEVIERISLNGRKRVYRVSLNFQDYQDDDTLVGTSDFILNRLMPKFLN